MAVAWTCRKLIEEVTGSSQSLDCLRADEISWLDEKSHVQIPVMLYVSRRKIDIFVFFSL